jgi:hypothetical protein
MTVRARLLAPLLGVLVMPAAARAATIAPVRVDVAPSNVCGDAEALEARIAARGVVVSSTAETTATVDVSVKGDGLEGSLVLTRNAGTTNRVVHATTCADVLDALAFTLGLALENEAVREPPASPSTSPESPSTPPGTVERAATPVRPPVLELELGGGGGALRMAAPAVAGSAGAWLLIGARRKTPFSPSAAVGIVFGLPVDTTVGATKTTSALQAGVIDLCPARFGGTSFGVRPCARTVIGRSQVKSDGFNGAQLDERTFVTLGLAIRGEARIAGPLFGHVELAAAIPAERATYFVAGSKIFETPVLATGGGIGVAVHFL